MTSKQLWIALLAIPVCLISVLIIGAERSRPAIAGGVIDPTCISSLPCIEYDNNGTGPAIRGVALNGNGVAGATHINSTSATNARFGVFGKDDSTSGAFNSGVSGLSVRGTGVSGVSTSGKGISGNSSSGPGISGTSTSGDGVDGSGNTGVLGSGTNIGVLGSSSGTGVEGNSSGGGSGVSGNSTLGEGVTGISGNSDGVSGTSTSFYGVFGSSVSSNASIAGLEGTNVGFGTAIRAKGNSGSLFVGNNFSGVDVFTVDDGGNIVIAGKITTSGTCHVGCAKPAAPGYHVVSYAPTESLPTMEDTGEAQLSNGSAYVRIDPAFANVIDQIANYVVLITPEGDSRGLYVTQKSGVGFAVHENQGGHSTLAFGYRIVAKPISSKATRLPMIYIPKILPPIRPGGLRPSQLHG